MKLKDLDLDKELSIMQSTLDRTIEETAILKSALEENEESTVQETNAILENTEFKEVQESPEVLAALNQLIENQVYMFDVSIALIGIAFGIMVVLVIRKVFNVFL